VIAREQPSFPTRRSSDLVYTDAKRKGGGKTISGDAVGIDCSGFICRCWKLTTRHSTESLPSICEKLSSPAELKPGDIMNGAGARSEEHTSELQSLRHHVC